MSKRPRKGLIDQLVMALEWLVDLRETKGVCAGGRSACPHCEDCPKVRYERDKDVAWRSAQDALARAQAEGFTFTSLRR